MITTPDTGQHVPIDLRRAVRWRWPVLVGVAFAGLLMGSLVAALRPPQYEATAVAAIVPSRSAGFPGADYVTLAAPSYIAFATSPDRLESVASQAGLDVGELRSSLAVAVQGGSNTITVVVHAGSPALAAHAADLITYGMTQFHDKVTSAVVVAPASAPSAPRVGEVDLLRGAGLVGGIAAGLALVWILERRRPHIAVASDLALGTGSVVLGTLPRSASLRHRHPGAALEDPAVEAASHGLITELLARLPHGRGVVLVTAARTGAGVSTVSEVLSFAADLIGRKVVLLRPVEQPATDPSVDASPVGFVEVPMTGPPSQDPRDDAGTPLGLREAASSALDRFDIAVIDAPPIMESRWRADAADVADRVVLVASPGDVVDRLRTASLLASSLAAADLVAIGNRMPLGSSPSGPDEPSV